MSKKPSRTKPARTEPGTPLGNASDPMDPSLLEQIVKLMAANDLNMVDVRDGQRRVILKRGPAVGPVTYAAAPTPQAIVAQSGPMPGPGPGGEAAPTPTGEAAGTTPIVSPMVGTFYSKSSPDAKPFVTVGSRVDEETVVCIVEAMKHYNPVKAEVRGTIARILVSDGEVVDVNKPMFLVKP
jgi:acetyl-CoA carboxylase biotin carboxyl carrier protein